MTSPVPMDTTPTTPGLLRPSAVQGTQFPAPRQPIAFNTLPPFQEPSYTLSAQMLFEIAPPTVPFTNTSITHRSSGINALYANITRLSPMVMPPDLSGYNQLPTTASYHPPQLDPTLSLEVEADAIRTCHFYIISPVNMVLFNNTYQYRGVGFPIRSRSEDRNCFSVDNPPTTAVNHLSRVDFSWEVRVNNQWRKFAVL
jgi:hypothetical protein